MERAFAISNSYNTLAEKEGWPSICDAGLHFRTPGLKAVLAIWREKAGVNKIPRREDMTLRCLKTVLPNVAIYQRVVDGSGRRYKVRLIGTRFAEVMGDLTGRYLDEAIPAHFLPRWCATLDAAQDAGAPLRFLGRSDTANKSFLVGEYFEAPLLDENGEANLVMGASHFSAARSWAEIWAAEHPNTNARLAPTP